MSNTQGIVRQRVISVHLRNPEWTAWRIGEECKCDSSYVRRVLGWKAPRRVDECSTPSLDPDTPALPHSADDIWEERRNAESCAFLLARLQHYHPEEAG
jgi:hypothetical protein